MTLQYAIPNTDVLEIISKLKDLSLAHKKEQVNDLATTVLVDGKQKIIGATAILSHLDTLEQELQSWYYCNC